MLRDRGTMKWTSLMLPEHVEIMKKMWQEDKKITPPELDEHALEQLNEACLLAYHTQHNVCILVYNKGAMQEIEGKITALLPHEQSVRIQTSDYRTVNQAITHIYSIQ